MFQNHLKIALRTLWKNKLFTTIKLAGLTAGFAACLLIGLYLRNELSYDACHLKADRIARTIMEYRMEGELGDANVCGTKVAPAFRRDFPEVESAVRLMEVERVVNFQDKRFEEKHIYFADSTLFDIFTFPLVEGDPATALDAPDRVVLSENMAEKYFGTQVERGELLGKVMTFGSKEFIVSGIMKNAPSTSQLKPDFLLPYHSLDRAKPENENWWNANEVTYLLLYQPENIAGLQQKIPGYMRAHSNEHGAEGDDYLSYRLEPLRDVHLRSDLEGSFEPNGDIRYIYILSAVGLLILLIGVTTYVNLTTASSMERAREVGIQKVMGAGRINLIWQHLSEAGLTTAFALVAGFLITLPLLPTFNRLFERQLSPDSLFQTPVLLLLLVFGGVVALLAGAYPALMVSGFQPVKVLKGNWGSSKQGGGAWLRQSLIVLQFAISGFLLISTFVLQKQLHYIQNKKIGFEREHVIVLPTDQAIIEKLPAIKTEFLQNPNVRAVSLAYETPIHIKGGYGIAKSISSSDYSPVVALPADEDFLKTMNIELAAGSNFTATDRENMQRRYEGDTTLTHALLVNEQQAKAFGWTATEAVGKRVNFQGKHSVVKGVVKDFHFASLHEPIGNLVIFPDTWGNSILIKLSGEDIPAALGFLEAKWPSLAPHRPFSYHFLEEEFDRMYSAEMQMARLITSFSGLAILLACLGLFGLVSYMVTQRTKEIGIRKVLGANVAGIVGLLSKDFLKLVVVALVIASPLAYFLMNNWLQDFAYRIEIQWWVFALAGAVAIGVAFLTVSLQSIKAALANPVKSLRSE